MSQYVYCLFVFLVLYRDSKSGTSLQHFSDRAFAGHRKMCGVRKTVRHTHTHTHIDTHLHTHTYNRMHTYILIGIRSIYRIVGADQELAVTKATFSRFPLILV